MRIYTFIPSYAQGGVAVGDLGAAYNQCMNLIGKDDWACFIDHDAMFTTVKWWQQITSIVEESEGKVGLYTCMTNAVACNYQVPTQVLPRTLDYYYHRSLGQDLESENWLKVVDVTDYSSFGGNLPISGVLMLTSYKAWREVGGFDSGFLGVDNDYHRRIAKAGLEVRLMLGVYVMHWYRSLKCDGREFPEPKSKEVHHEGRTGNQEITQA